MTDVRTSASDPLRIGEVTVNAAGARLGITFCPGKKGQSASAHRWDRDLEADLDMIVEWGARIVITLIEEHEFSMLGVPELGSRVEARGIEWIHLPITDLDAPDERFETGWRASREQVMGCLNDGGRVLVHCRGGLGRAGTVAAFVLIESGMKVDEAVYRVRKVRPGAIETAEQMRYLHRLRPSP
jgi:protein-tyrosine phosphatase